MKLTEITREFSKVLEARLGENLNFIQVVLGPRQVGKTTAIKQILKRWPHSKIFETADKLSAPDVTWIEAHWRRARQLQPPVLLVFDEIQKIEGWSERVKILFDQDRQDKNLKVVLLGSASLSIQKGLTETLAGRFEVIRAHHWGLSECRDAFGWGLEEFLMFGGYPAGASLINDPARWKDFMCSSVLEPVLSRDILDLSSISKPALLRQTFEMCLQYPAQELSLNKILGSLQARGNVTTIRHYLDLFEGAFLLKTLQKYSGSAHTRKSSIPKLLPLAPSLAHAFTDPFEIKNNPEWRGRIFELAVGTVLSRKRGELFYWREGNFEVDYVLRSDDKKIYAVEVKSSRLRKSERGFGKFLEHYKKAIPVIVTIENFEKLDQSRDIGEFVG